MGEIRLLLDIGCPDTPAATPYSASEATCIQADTMSVPAMCSFRATSISHELVSPGHFT